MKIDSTYLNELLNKLTTINNKVYPNPKKKDGDIGERFVKDSIKYYMWEKCFKLRSSGNRTFKIQGQYKAGRGGMGGIDFRFGFTYNKIQYDCYIETKNWSIYPITPSTFQTEILSRFTQNANQLGCIWLLTINKGLINQITNLCSINNVYFHIVSIDRKITSRQLNANSLRVIMEHFLDDFDKLMTTLTGIKLRKPFKKIKTGSKLYDDAIRLGLSPGLIANMFGTSKNNIQKRASQLRANGEDILDQRKKTAVLARFINKSKLDKIYIEIIRKMMEEEYKDKNNK